MGLVKLHDNQIQWWTKVLSTVIVGVDDERCTSVKVGLEKQKRVKLK